VDAARLVEKKEIGQSSSEATADRFFGDVVASALNAQSDTLNGDLFGR
jgi:hypothetical protein